MQKVLKTKLNLGSCLSGASVFFFRLSTIAGLNSSPASAYSATINTSSSINLDVSPAGDGTSIHSESINVVSDCRSGYNLTIATPTGSNLYKYDSTNDTLDSTASFTSVDGTSSLSSNNNTKK